MSIRNYEKKNYITRERNYKHLHRIIAQTVYYDVNIEYLVILDSFTTIGCLLNYNL